MIVGHTLGSWNAERLQYWADKRRAVMHPEEFSNGLPCPVCSGKLYDTGQQVSSSPSVLRVKCQDCVFKGERLE
jgi:hypothetical protein